MPLTGQLQGYVSLTDTGTVTAPDLGTLTGPAHTILLQPQSNYAAGTGAAAADVLWQDINTLAASANTDVDLSGALTRATGGTSVFAKVSGLYIAADAANTNDVLVGAAATNPWATWLNATGTLRFRPGAWMVFGVGDLDTTRYAVTATTADLLRFANSGAGTSVTYRVAIIGTSV